MRAFVLLVAFLIGFASPARAADDVAAVQGVIRSQVEAFGRDDAAAAYSYAAPAIRDLFPQADIFMIWSAAAMLRSIGTGVLNSARPVSRTA